MNMKPTLTPPRPRRRVGEAWSYRSRMLVGIAFAMLAAGATAVIVILPERVAQRSKAPALGTTGAPGAPALTAKAPEASRAGSTSTPGPLPQRAVPPASSEASPPRGSAERVPRPGGEQAGGRTESPRDQKQGPRETGARVPGSSRPAAPPSPPRPPAPSVDPKTGGDTAPSRSDVGPIPPPQPPPDVSPAPRPSPGAAEYERAVAAALEALERNDAAAAQQALESAERLRPDAPEVRHLSKTIQEGRQRRELERIRRAAADHEAGERWQPALQEYEAALRIDKNATFAVRGKTRAEKVIAIKQQIEFYVANPDRLQSPGPLAHAKDVLAAAAASPDGEASLRAGRDRLRALIDQATSPRAVRLRSDETTDVVVHQVGRLGRFRERELTLLPGEYTAVGSRAGYRDTRIRFRVSPDQKETIVEIRCEERI